MIKIILNIQNNIKILIYGYLYRSFFICQCVKVLIHFVHFEFFPLYEMLHTEYLCILIQSIQTR